MDQRKLRSLIRGGETAAVDFKLECNAFQGSKAATAELVKDIVALANNGNRTSYLLIGIGDDGRSFKTPRNPNLTDDAVQDLVSTAILPIPRVRVLTETLKDRGGAKLLTVVRVGPNKRRAYAFARDFINHHEKLAFKKHEVWIRRGATSDLASPEEVAALEQGKDLQALDLGGPADRVYGRMPYGERPAATLEDFAAADPRITVAVQHQLASVEVAGRRMLLRVLYSEVIPAESLLHFVLQRAWGYEHGLLVITPGRIPKRYFWKHQLVTPGSVLDSKESFGVYAQVPLPGSDPKQQYDFGLLDETYNKATRNGPPLVLPVFVVSGFRSTEQVLKKGRALATALNEEGLSEQVLRQMSAVEEALASIVEKGRIIRDRAHPPGKDQVSITEADPNRVRSVEGDIYRRAARSILEAARSTDTELDPEVRVLGEELVGFDTEEMGQRMLLDELKEYDPEGWRIVGELLARRRKESS